MSSTRAHKTATGLLAGLYFGAAAACWWYAVGNPVPLAEVGIGTIIGLVTDPDDDLGEKSKSLFRRTYGKLFKHRSFWSHFPIVSTTTRMLVFAPLWLLALAALLAVRIVPQIDTALHVCSGLAMSDALHWLMDVTPGLRRL